MFHPRALLGPALVTALALILLGPQALAAEFPGLDLITKGNSPPPTNTDFINTALEAANAVRRAHTAPPLEWDAAIAAAALKKSNGCELNHTGPYGENAYLWWSTPPDSSPNFTERTRDAFASWASETEINAYRAGDLYGGGHFTQTVWKASRRMGCAFSTIRCENNPEEEWWLYCDFEPRGNVYGSAIGAA